MKDLTQMSKFTEGILMCKLSFFEDQKYLEKLSLLMLIA